MMVCRHVITSTLPQCCHGVKPALRSECWSTCTRHHICNLQKSHAVSTKTPIICYPSTSIRGLQNSKPEPRRNLRLCRLRKYMTKSGLYLYLWIAHSPP